MKKSVVLLFCLFLMTFFIYPASCLAEQSALTPIMGHGELSCEQMASYLFDNNDKNGLNPISKEYALSFAEAVIEYSCGEGVNHDIAFALMMHETGYLSFGGDVAPSQNNFGGLGATGGGESGASFSDMREGILAVVQHLKCYASNEPLNYPCVDPRFSEALRGKAVFAEHLGYSDNPNATGWAYPGEGYGVRLLNIAQRANGNASLSVSSEQTAPPNAAENAESSEKNSSSVNISDVSVVVLTLVLIILLKFLFTKPNGKTSSSLKRRKTRNKFSK